jgi:type IX secretion system PorP/SprF family membrane protein
MLLTKKNQNIQKNTAMKKIIISSVICLFSIQAFAQNDAQFTQFYANRLYHNPAATGFSDKFMASATYRTQWVGSGLATNQLPLYILFNAAQYFAEQRSGVGLTIYNARHGAEQITQAKASYAYHLQVQEESWLAIGINLGFLSKGIRDGVPNDGPLWNSKTYAMSDLGLGLEYYTPELQVGFAAQHIPFVLGAKEERKNVHFYYYATYFYTVNDEWRVIPSVVLRNPSFLLYNYDISARVSYLNMFQFGLSYRRDAIAILLGFNYDDTYSIGYSFDIRTSSIDGIRPSHEIVLNYRTQLFNKEDTRLQRLNASHDF